MSTILPANLAKESQPLFVAKQVIPHSAEVELPLHLFSVADYERMGELGVIDEDARVELLEGVIVYRDEHPSVGHRPLFVAKDNLHRSQSVELPLYEFTNAEYERMLELGILTEADKVELLQGIVIEMSPKGQSHNYAVDYLADALHQILGKDWYVRNQGTLELVDAEPEPDLIVLRGRPRDYHLKHPQAKDAGMVIEVADSSLSKDRITKGFLYSKFQIPIYWIVNLVDDCLEIYNLDRAPSESRYLQPVIKTPGQMVDVEIEGKVFGQINLAELFAS